MNLIEVTPPPGASFPVAQFAEHLRLGTGFADDGSEDAALEGYLRAAVATVEGRTGKILLERVFSWELTRWFAEDRQGLPVGPVASIGSVVLVTAAGEEVAVDAGAYTLRRDLFRPEIAATRLPSIPTAGTVRITFTAGFGPAWSDVPADLAQAVMMLAAQNYESRADHLGMGATMPFGVLALIERYKTVRVLGDIL